MNLLTMIDVNKIGASHGESMKKDKLIKTGGNQIGNPVKRATQKVPLYTGISYYALRSHPLFTLDFFMLAGTFPRIPFGEIEASPSQSWVIHTKRKEKC
jgi:hypothetical protein